MMNMITGKHRGKLAFQFMLVHDMQADSHLRFPLLFSIYYFHHKKDGSIIRSKNQGHMMDGIAVGRCPTSNSMLVYNPLNKQFYEPGNYKLDPFHIPGALYLSIKYNGGLFLSFHWGDAPTIDETSDNRILTLIAVRLSNWGTRTISLQIKILV